MRFIPTPLSSLRVFFTLRHTTLPEIITSAFGGADGTLRDEALAGWLERDSGFGEGPVKRPLEMRVEIQAARVRAGGAPRLLRFERRFTREPAEVLRVQRVGDLLYQDSQVAKWDTIEGGRHRWSVDELEGATLGLRASYLSFDDINFRRPPAFHSLQLYFGGTVPAELFFTEEQLAAPTIAEDPAPLLHGPFFKTLVIEYRLTVTPRLLAQQLVAAPDRRRRARSEVRDQKSPDQKSPAQKTLCSGNRVWPASHSASHTRSYSS